MVARDDYVGINEILRSVLEVAVEFGDSFIDGEFLRVVEVEAFGADGKFHDLCMYTGWKGKMQEKKSASGVSRRRDGR